METDGTLKIMRKDSIGIFEWDTNKPMQPKWSKPATLNTYLNNETEGADSYYNTLSNEAKSLIQNHTWGIGSVTTNNKNLTAQIASENGTSWSGNIGLISASDVIKTSSNMNLCGTMYDLFTNGSTCKFLTYLDALGYLWTISPSDTNYNVWYAKSSAGAFSLAGNLTSGRMDTHPALYLKSDITLSGEGSSSNPYTINS